MDFVRSYFRTNEPLTSWTLLSSLFFQISTNLEKKWGQKGSTGQRFICIKVTSYKIHTLNHESFWAKKNFLNAKNKFSDVNKSEKIIGYK